MLNKACLAVLGAFLVFNGSRADVVLDNFGSSNNGQGIAFSTTTPASISWTNAGFSGYFSKIKIRAYNNGYNSLNNLSLSFGLDSQANSVVSNWIARAGDLSPQGYSDWEYNLGSSLTFNQGSSGTLYIKLYSQQENASAYWATTPNAVSAFFGWTGGTTTNPASGQFQLSGTAVPEPATWLLMGLAQAMVGGWWVWRKRRSNLGCALSPAA